LHTPLLEIDFNLHKSNSTYFSDLDVARAYHSGVLFGPLFMPKAGGKRCNLVVGAVSCTFKREIKFNRGYEMFTKVAGWDEKWIYMVTHFVERGRAKPQPGLLQGDCCEEEFKDDMVRPQGRGVFASAITRMVFKRGRVTVPPIRALDECGLLCDTGAQAGSCGTEGLETDILEELETQRRKNLSIAQLQQGWDKVHEIFNEQQTVLGRFTDMAWC
jgi:hypothetical protein